MLRSGLGRLTALRGNQRQRVLAIAIVLGAAGLLFSWPENLPGLNLDEAWCFRRAQEILDGERFLDGMNYYTGSIQQYLLAGGVWLFGRHVWVARLLSGAANVGMLVAYMQLVRGLHPGKDTWLWVGALTMTSANFVAFSRFSTEITALTPCFILTGLMLAQRGWRVQRWGWAWAFAGSVLLGLAVYNHMAAVAIVAGLCLAYLVATGWRCILDPRSYAAAAGLLVGLAPRLIQILRLPPGRMGPTQRLLASYKPEIWEDLLFLPSLLRGMIDGDLIYRNYAGRCLLWVVPFFSVGLGVLWVARLVSKKFVPSRRDLGLCVAILVSMVLVTFISQGLALRYFVLPTLAVPYLLARASLADAKGGAAPWARRLGTGTLSAVVALQALYVGVNYFYSHLSRGGKASVFLLGKRLLETSDGFIRTDRLYAQLVEKNIENFVAWDVIGWCLRYYDWDTAQFLSGGPPGSRGWHENEGATALIHFNGPLPIGGLEVDDFRGTQSLELDGHQFLLESGIDHNFLVYVYRP